MRISDEARQQQVTGSVARLRAAVTELNAALREAHKISGLDFDIGWTEANRSSIYGVRQLELTDVEYRERL